MAGKGLALVTGASSGIGYQLALELAKDGYDLVVAGKQHDRTEKIEADARSHGVQVKPFVGDLSQFQVCMDLWHAVESMNRPLDVACINAGLGVGGDFVKTPLEQELEIVGVNCASTVHLAKHVVQHMVSRNAGRILFTASIASEMLTPGEAVYGASKAFVLQFAKNLRYELKDSGVTVTALQPGPVDTDFFNRAGVGDTKVGTEGKKDSEPGDVARQGLKALFAGDEHVYAASLKTKLEGAMMGVVPEGIQSSMHKSMMEPAEK